jgi:hypothetical protein
MPLTTEQIAIIEKACAAWWDIEQKGKRVATHPWDHPYIKDEWKKDYRDRMAAALMAVGAL